MNRNHIIGLGITVLVLVIAGLLIIHNYEIYPDIRYINPSDEAISNDLLALQRWLSANDINYRIVNSAHTGIFDDTKESLFIQSSSLTWSEELNHDIIKWISNGGHLFLSIDNIQNDYHKNLLNEFGIDYIYGSIGEILLAQGIDYPTFDYSISFTPLSTNNDIIEFKDELNYTRLAQLNYGQGKITITGYPSFLINWHLGRDANSNIAWYIFMHENAGEDWLFISSTPRLRNERILGSLFNQGNFSAVIISLLVLIITGFWAFIPMFGTIKKEEVPDKSIRARFLYEGLFMKNHGALKHYNEIYIREINRNLMRKNVGLHDSNNEIKDVQLNTSINNAVNQKNFINTLISLKNILESI